MATFKEYIVGENFSIQIDSEDFLTKDHLCRQMEQIVSELDINSIESTYSDRGQNAFHPKLLLSIIFYGYAIGIRSGRKLEAACKENIVFIYLSKGYRPSKTVINDFRKNNYQHFSKLFDQILQKCLDADIGDPSLSIVDGSMVRANSNKKRTKTKEKFEKWQRYLLEDIASIEEEVSRLESSIQQDRVKKN